MGIDTVPPFSARNRRESLPIDDAFPASARTGLLHLIRQAVSERYIESWFQVAKELQRIGRPLGTPLSEYEAKKEADRILT